MRTLHSRIVVFSTLIILLIAGGWFVLMQRPVSNDTATSLVEIQQGQQVRSIARTLKNARLISSENTF